MTGLLWPRLGLNVFAERRRLFEALRTGEELAPLVRRMATGSFLCALAYGAVLGVQIGGWQVFSSPVKLPLILLGTSVLCLGSLYVLLALAGFRLRWLQVAGLVLCAVTASSLAMAALLPVAAFWTFTAQNDRHLATLTHSAAFFIAGALGARFGLEAATEVLGPEKSARLMVAWMLLYGLVAQQMAWLFRPHFHPTDTFMRPVDSGGSALDSLAKILLQWLP